MVKQDHQAVKRNARRWGGESCEAAPGTLAGIGLRRMIRNGQLASRAEQAVTVVEQFSL
jgi:hypothetical protein